MPHNLWQSKIICIFNKVSKWAHSFAKINRDMQQLLIVHHLSRFGGKGPKSSSRKKKRLSTLKDFRINPLTLLLMSSSTSTHTLDHQLRFQRRTTPPTIPTILLLFFLCNYVDNDNKNYIRKKTISWNDSCHCQTHQNYRRKRSRNSLPRE